MADDKVRNRIEETGSLIVGNTPEQFAAQTRAEYEVYKKVAEQQKLTLERGCARRAAASLRR